MSISHTRAIIDAIHSGDLEQAEFSADPIFGIGVPTSCPGVPSEVLNPVNTWADKNAYQKAAEHLAELFQNNFKKFSDQATDEVTAAGPKI